MKPVEQLIEFESMLHESVQRVGRAVRNLRQEQGGYSSTTPGNGSPGAGKGGGPTVAIDRPGSEPGRLPQDAAVRSEWERRRRQPDAVDHVPITSPESQALGFAGRDRASEALVELERQAHLAALGAALALDQLGHTCPGRHGQRVGPDRLVVLAYARVVAVRRLDPTDDQLAATSALVGLVSPVPRVFDIVQRWGYTVAEATAPKGREDVLAVDLTGRWCTSHLRIGDRRERARGELCFWCYNHGPQLVPTWVAPPVEVVRLHVENGRVKASEIEPFIKSERDRQRNLAKPRRKNRV